MTLEFQDLLLDLPVRQNQILLAALEDQSVLNFLQDLVNHLLQVVLVLQNLLQVLVHLYYLVVQQVQVGRCRLEFQRVLRVQETQRIQAVLCLQAVH